MRMTVALGLVVSVALAQNVIYDTSNDLSFSEILVEGGNWEIMSDALLDYENLDYLRLTSSFRSNHRVTITPTLQFGGVLGISVKAQCGTGMATSVPFEISHAQGQSIVHMDQSSCASGEWTLLGIFSFIAFSLDSKVVMDASSVASGVVSVDAFQFSPSGKSSQLNANCKFVIIS
jgi:hypothetical protein